MADGPLDWGAQPVPEPAVSPYGDAEIKPPGAAVSPFGDAEVDPRQWGAVPAPEPGEQSKPLVPLIDLPDNPHGLTLSQAIAFLPIQAYRSMKEFFTGPGRALSGEMTPQEQLEWGAQGALMEIGGGITGGVPAGIPAAFTQRLATEGAAGLYGDLATGRPGPVRPTDNGLDNGFFSKLQPGPGGPIPVVIGSAPRDADFQAAARFINPQDPALTEQNLRQLWQQRGIHPAEASFSADALFTHILRSRPDDVMDQSGIAPAIDSPVPWGTPRSELAKTGDPRLDHILEDPEVKDAIDNPHVNAENDVPYSAGPDNTGNGLNIDRHFPESMTVDGVAFDPAEPFAIHEFVERHVMKILMDAGMKPDSAYRVAHFEFAEKAEGAWYAAHGIDQAKAEAAYRPFIDAIDHEHPINPPPDLFAKPYPHDNARAPGSVETQKPTAEESEQASQILGERAELRDFVNQGTPVDLLTQHPIVQRALERYRSAPASATEEELASPAWRAARVYNFDGEQVKGWDNAVDRLTDRAKAFAGGQVLNNKRAVFVLGPPAAGKSTVAEALARELGAAIIDPDEAKKVIPGYTGGGSSAVHEESSKLAKAMVLKLGRQGANIIVPKVGDRVESIRAAIATFKRAGYTVDLAHVAATPEISGRRNIARFLDTGRLVPPGYIEQVGDKPRQTAQILRGEANEYLDADTSKPGPPRILEGEGQLADAVGRLRGAGVGQGPAGGPRGARPGARALQEAKELGIEYQGRAHALGADVSQPSPSLAQQPPLRPGRLIAAAQNSLDKLFDIGRDLQMKAAPMATGSIDSMALAKDFANSLRRNRWEWSRIDDDIAKRFTLEQRKRMWDAADEESVLRQEGTPSQHMGLATLTPEERTAVEMLQTRSQIAWLRARDLGMVEGEGLPAYTPRMVINAANAAAEDGRVAMNRLPGQIGRNLRTRTAQMLHRKYLTAEETETAAKAKLGEGAEILRDIRVLPLATAKLEDAIAGRTLINNIREYGKRTGDDTVADGFRPTDSASKWFTVDHPAFRTWAPRLERVDEKWQAVRDQDGNIVFEQRPLYVRGDFEGPLRAVLSERSGALYRAAMSLKGKTMSLVMNSPLIHNAVEWGRALPAMPGKVATFKVYFDGNRARNNPGVMREAINAGLDPIGHRFFNQDISSIAEEPNLTPGRSWTSQILSFVPGLFDESAGTAVKTAIDRAGNFWHNTLLWDNVAKLQMGLYVNFRDDLLAKGVDRLTAARAAAHWANRYAGVLPVEAMSANARVISNMLLFSRSFTLGNIGAMKDVLTGLPRDVLAQIERDAGQVDPKAVGFAKAMARRKAATVIAMDILLFHVGNSTLQSTANIMLGDSTLDKEMHDYAARLSEALTSAENNPLKLLQPFDFFRSLSATSTNEPEKQDYVRVGYARDGTAIYARNPVGKIGGEFEGWLTGPLDMIRRKLGTIARPAWQIIANDRGFGRKIYDPDADTVPKYLDNLGKIAMFIAEQQAPTGQIGAFTNLVEGQGEAKVNALQAFGPLLGVTFSKGAPGGPAIGELYHAREMHDYAVSAALPDIRRQIQNGDVQGARDRLIQLGVPRGLREWYVRTTLNPALRLSKRALDDFYQYATPEQKSRLQSDRAQ